MIYENKNLFYVNAHNVQKKSDLRHNNNLKALEMYRSKRATYTAMLNKKYQYSINKKKQFFSLINHKSRFKVFLFLSFVSISYCNLFS